MESLKNIMKLRAKICKNLCCKRFWGKNYYKKFLIKLFTLRFGFGLKIVGFNFWDVAHLYCVHLQDSVSWFTNFRKYRTKILCILQVISEEQLLSSLEGGLQSSPPNWASGLSHVLDRFQFPIPHSPLNGMQMLQEDHIDQSPFTIHFEILYLEVLKKWFSFFTFFKFAKIITAIV